MEIYKDIEGYEGLYQISSNGVIRSLGNDKTRKEKILKPAINNKGYLYVGLHKQRKRKHYLIHRLVAEAFIPNPNNYPIINHKDENPLNNNVSNLEWCTYEHNNNYGTRNQRVAASCTNNQKKSKPVFCLETGVVYPSASEVERQLGFLQGNISACCNGKRKQVYGFHWKYVS